MYFTLLYRLQTHTHTDRQTLLKTVPYLLRYRRANGTYALNTRWAEKCVTLIFMIRASIF